MADLMGFIRRRSGTVAAAAATVGFVVGAAGAFRVLHAQSPAPILLRQATEGDPMATYDLTPGAGGVLVLLRNDGTTPVEVTDAAFARTSAAPPLYIAPETVQPGADVNVYVAIPGPCSGPLVITDQPAPPVTILVSAQPPGGQSESVPVEVVGQFAQIMASCHHQNDH